MEIRIYLASVYTSGFGRCETIYSRLTPREQEARCSHPYILESYHYVNRQKYVDKMRRDGMRVFLDSGAFSAHTKGAVIDLQGYCEYIKRNQDIIAYSDNHMLASVLDGIGDPMKTYQNQLAMEAQGVRPLPCFHYGEDERWLEWYISHYEYITIGGMVPITTSQLYYWLDRIWDKYLCDGSGHARLKVHGFGLTTVDLIKRYPWYSVDSSSWMQSANNGGIYLPKTGTSLHVSAKSPARKIPGAHLDNLPPVHRQAIIADIEQAGFEVPRLQASAYSRWSFNFWAFDLLNQRMNKTDRRFKAEQPGLF